MPRVLTVCPNTADVVPTHAVMTEEAFKRLKAGMALYCPSCNQPHMADRRLLWLETTHQTLGHPLPDAIANELEMFAARKEPSSARDAPL
jgi:hypothetical protein